MSKFQPFSVCMCVYGKDDPRWFRQAVDSITNQTVKPSQVVLVVDGAVPEALDAVIRECEALENFDVIRLPENRGLGIARRTGLEHCTCELVAMMDADDISLPDRFELQLRAFAENPRLSIVGGQISEFIDTEDHSVGYRQVPLTNEEIRRDIKTRCPMNHVTVMAKLADIRRAGGYQDWYCNEDYWLWIRMYLADMEFANVPQTLVNVRVGDEMYMRRGGRKYFASELGIQKQMRKHKMIGWHTYLINVAKRVVVQLLMPNRMRVWVFKTFARTQKLDG